MSITLALDKQSARRIDANGYLHVEPNPISKATVNPYKGSEIPGCEQLGLDPNKVYYLLRDPKELKKAATTFNNLPILSKHIPVSSFDMDKPEVKALYVGSTGTDAEFDGTYLNNTLVLHAKSAIDDIQAKKKHELSCAYRYQPDMTPGTFEGQHYDGIMRGIQGNHVALVTEGRAGHDVKVMDSKNGGAKVVDYRKVSAALGKDSAEKVRAVLFGLDRNAMDGSITKEVQGSDYETAEAAAKSAGTLAGMQPTPENRKQAARLSREAARLHRSAGFTKQAKYWDEVADEFSKPAGGAKDSNPEGINQYNSAAAAAKSASNKAAKLSSTTSEHAKAAAAHTKAAEAHRNAAEKAKATGNNFPVRGHEEKAAYHEKAAELETRRSGSTKDSALDASSEGARDSNPEGINQYTGAAQAASKKAEKASKAATAHSEFATRQAVQALHKTAEKAHLRAAEKNYATSRELIKERGDEGAESKAYAQSAKEHEAAAAMHSGRAAHDSLSVADASITKEVRGSDYETARDSNPEGINQYTGAATKAEKASKVANATFHKAMTTEEGKGQRAALQKAALAHQLAVEAHQKAASVATKERMHPSFSSNHEHEANEHKKSAYAALSLSKSANDAASITKRDDVSSKAGEREYGDVAFADPKNNKYPLDTPEHVRAAASYFGMTKNRSQYGKEDQTKIDKRISAAERKFKLGKFAEGK